jgi:hypothetical protein
MIVAMKRRVKLTDGENRIGQLTIFYNGGGMGGSRDAVGGFGSGAFGWRAAPGETAILLSA